MSETVTHIGTIRKLTEAEQYQVVSSFKQDKGARPVYYDSDMEWFLDIKYADYVKVGEDLYCIVEQTITDGDVSVFTPVEGKPNTHNFVFSFYNGGTTFHEMLEEAIEKKEKILVSTGIFLLNYLT